MAPLTREQLLAATTRPVVSVEAPMLGGTVCMRQLSAAEALQVYSDADQAKSAQQLLALTLCDEAGNRFFSLEDAAALYAAHPFAALQPLVDQALRINGMTKEAADDARKG